MPQVLVPIVTLGGILGPVGSSIAMSAALSALQYTVQALSAAGKSDVLPPASSTLDNLKGISRTNLQPARVVYGTAFLSGLLVYAQSVNELGIIVGRDDSQGREPGKFLHVVLAMSEGPISTIDSITLNDQSMDAPIFANRVLFVVQQGFSDQQALGTRLQMGRYNDSDLGALWMPKEWRDGERRLRGIAYLHGVLFHHRDVFPSGAPTITARVVGRLLYDPRNDDHNPYDEYTWEHSDNLALCIRDFCVAKRYGMGYRAADLDASSFEDSMDTADENVAIPVPDDAPEGTPTTQKRYTCNGIYQTDQNRPAVLEAMLATGAGKLTYVGGKYYLRLGKAVNPLVAVGGGNFTLTEDERRGAIRVTPKPGRADRVNIVRGTFVNPDRNFEPDNFPEVRSEEFVRQDGGAELVEEVDYPFVNNVYHAQRLARIRLLEARQGIIAEYEAMLPALETSVWDVIQVTEERLEWTNKLMRIVDWKLNPNGDGVNLLLKEYAASIWTDPDPDDLTIPVEDDAADTELPSPFTANPPRYLFAEETVTRRPDGSRRAVVRLSWDAPLETLVHEYVIVYRHMEQASTAAVEVRTKELRHDFADLSEGLWIFQVRTINKLRHQSGEVATSIIVTYVGAPPIDVRDLRFELLPNGVRLFSWTYAAEPPPDLAGVELRYIEDGTGENPNAEWNDAAPLSESGSPFRVPHPQQQVETILPVKTGNYAVYARPFDLGLQYSSNVAVVLIYVSAREIGALVERQYEREGWPGTIIEGTISENGFLQGEGNYTWADLTTWAAWTCWGDNAKDVVYLTDVINLNESRLFDVEARVDALGTDEVRVTMRERVGAQENFTRFHALRTVTAQYVQFRLEAIADGDTAPVIKGFGIVLRELMQEELHNDVDMKDLGSWQYVSRLERTRRHWENGDQRNVMPRRSATAVQLELGLSPSLELNGTNQYIAIPDSVPLRLAGGFTVQIALRLDNLTQTNKRVIGKGDDWFVDYAYGGGTGTFTLGASGYTGDDPATASPITVTDAFPFWELTWTYDGHGNLTCYRNDELIGEYVRAFAFAQSSAALAIGADTSGAPTAFLAAIVEEVRIWNRALASEEITGFIGTRVARDAQGLVGYWRCDDGSGTTVRDYSAAANNGTINGSAPTWVRAGYRESPPWDLGVVPSYMGGLVSSTQITPASTSIITQYCVDGATWQTAGPIVGLTAGQDLQGEELRVRQFLKSTNVASTPYVQSLLTYVVYKRAIGELVRQPIAQFAPLRSATLPAIQNSAPATWTLLAKNDEAARFFVYRPSTEEGIDALVDVLFKGGRLMA